MSGDNEDDDGTSMTLPQKDKGKAKATDAGDCIGAAGFSEEPELDFQDEDNQPVQLSSVNQIIKLSDGQSTVAVPVADFAARHEPYVANVNRSLVLFDEAPDDGDVLNVQAPAATSAPLPVASTSEAESAQAFRGKFASEYMPFLKQMRPDTHLKASDAYTTALAQAKDPATAQDLTSDGRYILSCALAGRPIDIRRFKSSALSVHVGEGDYIALATFGSSRSRPGPDGVLNWRA
ncbi:hypothetical protein OC834_003395 [Tilletia horrida]|nr:hypothetical protein OC834_003395 [Tilletia horrida]